MNVTIEISIEELKKLSSQVQRDVIMEGIEGFMPRDIKSEIVERVVKAAIKQARRHE